MRVFDLHCDTLSRCLDEKQPLYENDGHLDLKRGTEIEIWVQTFACFVDSKYHGQKAFERFLAQQRIFKDALCQHPQNMTLFCGGMHLKKGKCAAVLSVEGGNALAGKIENIAWMKKLGVSMLTLLWNGNNEIGSGALNGENRGLTPFGKECVEALEKNGIIIDISHLNDKGVDDVFSLSQKPVVASHSNLRTVCNHPRNITDGQYQEIVRRNGLCGLNFYPPFVNHKNDYSMDMLRRHLTRMLELGGEKTIAVGSDFDGASMPSFIKGIESLYTLYEAVIKWFGEKQADRIFYENAAEFAARNFLNNKEQL